MKVVNEIKAIVDAHCEEFKDAKEKVVVVLGVEDGHVELLASGDVSMAIATMPGALGTLMSNEMDLPNEKLNKILDYIKEMVKTRYIMGRAESARKQNDDFKGALKEVIEMILKDIMEDDDNE